MNVIKLKSNWPWIFLLLLIVSAPGCQRKTAHRSGQALSIDWKETEWGFREHIDSNGNEFWLFGSPDLCHGEVNSLVNRIEILKANAKSVIEQDYESGDTVKEFISFHQQELGIAPDDKSLWELVVPINRNSLHPSEGCTEEGFMLVDYEFYQSTDYVLCVTFSASGEITNLAMEH